MLVNEVGIAQNQDTLKTGTDTLQLCHSIENFAKKGKVSDEIFSIFFNFKRTPIADSVVKAEYTFEAFQGKIIRNINIETLDPFGYEINDTSSKAVSVFQKTGNFLHNKSSNYAIRNYLLVHEGEILDPYRLKESERLLRATSFVKDLKIQVVEIPGTDSIDIDIREQDLWTISGGISLVDSKGSFKIGDRNFAGLGHDVQLHYYTFPDRRPDYFTASYLLPSIHNTYISSNLFFTNNKLSYVNGIAINRPFYSPLTKWSGGIDFVYRSYNQTGEPLNSSLDSIKYNDFDIWLGRSFPLRKGGYLNQDVVNFILTGRYWDRKSLEVPISLSDTTALTADSKLYLTSFGLSLRTYYRDYYIYRFGIAEDVPTGSIVQVLLGTENSLFSNRLYWGLQAGTGNHFGRFGYVSLRFGYGNYMNNGKVEQGVVDFNVGYFSNLFKVGTWRMRQFVKVHSVYGLNRRASEFVNINEENGIRGFSASIADITNKMVLQFQTQFYLPYEFIGFRFAPFVYCNFAFTGNESYNYFHSRAYSTYGIGLLLKNELLVWSTFQFSIGLYPFIPGDGSWVLKFNPVKSYDFSFRDFDFSKPSLIGYE